MSLNNALNVFLIIKHQKTQSKHIKGLKFRKNMFLNS